MVTLENRKLLIQCLFISECIICFSPPTFIWVYGTLLLPTALRISFGGTSEYLGYLYLMLFGGLGLFGVLMTAISPHKRTVRRTTLVFLIVLILLGVFALYNVYKNDFSFLTFQCLIFFWMPLIASIHLIALLTHRIKAR